MKLLFLDIDGVLNTYDMGPETGSAPIHPDKVNRLNYILRVTGAQVVISSAWRWVIHNGHMDLIGFDWLLRSHGVHANRIHGITRKDDPYNPADDRGHLITEYLAQHKCEKYCVVDDLDLSITLCGHPFVQTVSSLGLTHIDMIRVISILNPKES